MHLARYAALHDGLEMGGTLPELKLVGKWEAGVCEITYAYDAAPPSALVALAGFPGSDTQSYFIPRSLLLPPPALLARVQIFCLSPLSVLLTATTSHSSCPLWIRTLRR